MIISGRFKTLKYTILFFENQSFLKKIKNFVAIAQTGNSTNGKTITPTG